jgi:uncharacterized protein with GYD domain
MIDQSQPTNRPTDQPTNRPTTMATYISLIRFTEKGASHIKNSTKRAKSFDETAEKHGITIVGQYWTVGRYDGVLILEADTEQQVLRCLVDLAAAGNVKAESLQAFDAAEFEQLAG